MPGRFALAADLRLSSRRHPTLPRASHRYLPHRAPLPAPPPNPSAPEGLDCASFKMTSRRAAPTIHPPLPRHTFSATLPFFALQRPFHAPTGTSHLPWFNVGPHSRTYPELGCCYRLLVPTFHCDTGLGGRPGGTDVAFNTHTTHTRTHLPLHWDLTGPHTSKTLGSPRLYTPLLPYWVAQTCPPQGISCTRDHQPPPPGFQTFTLPTGTTYNALHSADTPVQRRVRCRGKKKNGAATVPHRTSGCCYGTNRFAAAVSIPFR